MMNVKQTHFRVTVVVEPDGHEFHAFCPALKGLHVFGSSESEAVENAKIAIISHLGVLEEYGQPFPLGPDLKVLSNQPLSIPPAWMVKEVSFLWPTLSTSGAN